MFKIKFTTKSPLCQIDTVEEMPGDNSKELIIRVKKQKVFVNEYPVYVPVYTGNGFRGMLRREIFGIMLEAASKRSIQIASPEDFHLMNAGGGNLFNKKDLDKEIEIRNLNPLISMFGASLSIKGKLRVSNFLPYQEESLYTDTDGTGKNRISSLIGVSQIIAVDGILDNDERTKYLTPEQISKWIQSVEENTKKRSIERNNSKTKTTVKKTDKKEEPTKKKAIKSIISKEYVAQNVDFYGSISEIEKLTDIEKGLLIMGLERIVYRNLGATQSNNYGQVEYDIKYKENNSDSTIITSSVTKYGEIGISSNYDIDIDSDKKVVDYVSTAEEFLGSFGQESFDIARLLSDTKSDKKDDEKKTKAK